MQIQLDLTISKKGIMDWESRKKVSYVSQGELKFTVVLRKFLVDSSNQGGRAWNPPSGFLFTGSSLNPIKATKEAFIRIQQEAETNYNLAIVSWTL